MKYRPDVRAHDWSTEAVHIHVIGAGGTGSAVLAGLAQMAMALPQLGHPGIAVTVWDDDTVSQSNIGRQSFAPSDVGLNKAMVLVNRINLSLGLKWVAKPFRFTDEFRLQASILIGAVDTRKSREMIYRRFKATFNTAWIDCGNSANTGQVVLGVRENGRTVIPSVVDLFPEIADAEGDATDTQPSCSLAEALARQDLMINRFMADTAVNLLWRMLRHGELDTHGVFVDVAQMRMSPMQIDPQYWESLGWKQPESAVLVD